MDYQSLLWQFGDSILWGKFPFLSLKSHCVDPPTHNIYSMQNLINLLPQSKLTHASSLAWRWFTYSKEQTHIRTVKENMQEEWNILFIHFKFGPLHVSDILKQQVKDIMLKYHHNYNILATLTLTSTAKLMVIKFHSSLEQFQQH